VSADCVYLLINYVHKRRGGISDMSRTHVRAQLITYGTGTVVYTGKVCGALLADDARAEATRLATAWLAKNAADYVLGKVTK
jgi:hypothetical protein